MLCGYCINYHIIDLIISMYYLISQTDNLPCIWYPYIWINFQYPIQSLANYL